MGVSEQGWNVPSEHLIIVAYDAPSFEAYQKFGMEPEMTGWGAYSTNEIKIEVTLKEVGERMKQVQ